MKEFQKSVMSEDMNKSLVSYFLTHSVGLHLSGCVVYNRSLKLKHLPRVIDKTAMKGTVSAVTNVFGLAVCRTHIG